MLPEVNPAVKKWIDRVYEPIAGAVSDFTAKHSLCLEKYPRGNKSWELVGAHPKGGHVILLLMYDPIRGLSVGGIWQVGCEELGVYHSHIRKMRRCKVIAKRVVAILEEELSALLAAEYGHWTVTRPLPTSGSQPKTD